MATDSILKTPALNDKKAVEELVRALETAEKKQVKKVSFSRPVITADEDMMREIINAHSP